MSGFSVLAYVGAQLGLSALLLPALVALGYLTIRHVKIQDDPLRTGFVWLHVAIWGLFMSVPPTCTPSPR
jgi:hypothetical protein